MIKRTGLPELFNTCGEDGILTAQRLPQVVIGLRTILAHFQTLQRLKFIDIDATYTSLHVRCRLPTEEQHSLL